MIHVLPSEDLVAEKFVEISFRYIALADACVKPVLCSWFGG